MRESLQALFEHARRRPEAPAIECQGRVLTYAALAARVAGLAAALDGAPQVIGLLMPRDERSIVADLALALSGRTMVPLPDFFSAQQLAHIVADAKVEAVLTAAPLTDMATTLGVPVLTPEPAADGPRNVVGGARRIIYTSGTTGRPKGVVLGETQLDASIAALARAAAAGPADRHLSILPFSLLLEQIAGIGVPILAGACTVLCTDPSRFPVEAEAAAPTTTVLVPDLLSGWTRWLRGAGRTAPGSLRFVAVGGAPVAESLAAEAWKAGLPVHEGYGLSECCSVVAVNRPGDRRAGTVGRPLAGVEVTLDAGEIVVRGPTVMDGYLGGAHARAEWRTGDAGRLDADGRLVVLGRLDDVVVTTRGRNLHPEWVEPLILADARFARCAVVPGGAYPMAVVVPSEAGAPWVFTARTEELLSEVRRLCGSLPNYAVPHRVAVLSPEEAQRHSLFTPDGRPRRRAVANHISGAAMTFFDALQEATIAERAGFMDIPLVRKAVAEGVDRELYLDFLASAYHHVRHTVPLLALALARCGREDRAFAEGLMEYIDEEKEHDEWILDDIRALGGNAEVVRMDEGPFPVRMMCAYAYHMIDRVSPYALLGMVHVLEGMSVALAIKAADSIRAKLGASGGAGFSYLNSHGALDVSHVDFFARLLNAVDTPDRRKLVIGAAKDFYRLYGDIFRELDARRRQVPHAA